MNLSGTGSLNVTAEERIGEWGGTAHFNQTGGTNTAATLEVGAILDGTGTYALSGGTLNADFEVIAFDNYVNDVVHGDFHQTGADKGSRADKGGR